ncbi:MAG: hypothetical protein LAKADJCE_00512 [Candidatus Argoarchaeum ethanivorans]|uniref:Uncharacterized protein n=1 Tax=Candidatus Argoarchaeum ethanivorans TaxID=2608793 RepID=A0A811TFZ5_9EURY|nr:MAG: hypothetical protein LAKADJCE_00512 [Candidatus Argoarchaeum ethanivorans]
MQFERGGDSDRCEICHFRHVVKEYGVAWVLDAGVVDRHYFREETVVLLLDCWGHSNSCWIDTWCKGVIYRQYREESCGWVSALVSVLFVIIGVFCVFTGLILNVIGKEKEGRKVDG